MKYRKRPVVIEAIEWTGQNIEEIQKFAGEAAIVVDNNLWLNTLEGLMFASVTDMIVKGVDGEFYPCRKNIFELTYEEVKG